MTTLRNPRESDAPAISALMEELGHPMEPHQIVAQLRALVKHPGAAAWVAEQDETVIGYGQSHIIPSLHYPKPVALLTALVVAQRVQGSGIGKQLVAEIERWARAQGAERISLTSALHREPAHAFYKKLGYEHTGVRLAKQL
jgi:predicted N-acetyltransferase YhbS